MKPFCLGLVLCASLSLSMLAGCADVPDATDTGSEGIIRGKTEKKLPQVVAVRINLPGNGWVLCSGTYFAPRVVVTAAHCLRGNAIPGQSFVYFGDDYLTDVASLPVIPPPGQPSVWARIETAAAHPDYNADVNYPDFAIMHLDRELPFDPIPLLRTPVTADDKKGEIAGWGGSKALTADITQVEGAGIKRSAKVKILGTPTEADYHPDDPNAGILDPAIRANLLKTNGLAPSANTCAGDSGGPLLIERNGKTYLAGVGFWTGLFCEDYAIFTRIDPFLAFFDDVVARAGKAQIVPRLECIEPQADGSFAAHFGYRNDNALTVTVPYGKKNQFAADTAQARPRDFKPGDYPFDFAVPFSSGQELSWKLLPPGGPSTTVVANASSPVCDPTDKTFTCAKKCDAQFAAECANPYVSRPGCVEECVASIDVLEYYGCGNEWRTYLGCIATVPPPAANWSCGLFLPPEPAFPNCDPEFGAVLYCLYGY
jgi:secreted trypsin-like serine protease